MLEAMLVLDPEKRITASEGLSHPFLEEFHDPDAEPESPPYDDSFESMELVVGEWKSEYFSVGLMPHNMFPVYFSHVAANVVKGTLTWQEARLIFYNGPVIGLILLNTVS